MTKKKLVIEEFSLTSDQVFSFKAQYDLGKKHLEYFEETSKYFKNPELRIKTFDTVYYEENLPEIERALRSLGQIK